MINIINKFLLTGDNFMPEMSLRQQGFRYSACEPFTQDKIKIQKLKAIESIGYICQKELVKVCFECDMVCEDHKDLPRKTALTKCRVTKHLQLFVSHQNGRYQGGPSSGYKFIDKISTDTTTHRGTERNSFA